MDVPGPERRLAAVVAADMVGYSRLMEVDETGTLARLKTHRIELIDPAIAKNRGRIIKTTGDGMLVEFHSVADAVLCAAEIQPRMARRNTDVSPARWIQFRIGINTRIMPSSPLHSRTWATASRLPRTRTDEALVRAIMSTCPHAIVSCRQSIAVDEV